MQKQKFGITLFLLALSLTPIAAQKDSVSLLNRVIEKFTHDNRPPDKPRFLIYPTLAYSPETNLEIGAAAALLFHAKNDYLHNRLSEITAFGFVTLRSQYGLWLDHAVYTDQDKWLLLGRLRFQRFPLLYYGIGPDASAENPDVADGFGIQIRERAFRSVKKNLFAGIEVSYHSLTNVTFENEVNVRPLPLGHEGSANIGLGVGVAYDSRPNMLNTRDGWFAELAWLHHNNLWNSDFEFDNINADVRWYKKINKREVFAWQFFGSITVGEVPFNQLSLLGGEMMMRGYYTGRYRDKHYYATQAEYRFLPLPFSKRIGAAAFAGFGTVAPELQALRTDQLLWSGGIGLRYLMFPKKDIFLRFDVGFTREGSGFYIFTGEAF